MKRTLTFLKISVAIVIVALAAFIFAGCQKSNMPSFMAEYQDSLTQKDLLWLNSLAERGDSIGMITGIKRLNFSGNIFTQIKNKYVFYITQPIDHKNPEFGTFKQRIVIDFTGWDKPVDLQTEGYNLDNATNPYYAPELVKLFSANVVFVEHRYFGKSVPFVGEQGAADFSKLNWDYLTSEQEAADLHLVREKLGLLLKGKWLASGVSKGGINTLTYTLFYPEDVVCSVPYVTPVCNGINDGRMYRYTLDSAWTADIRSKMLNFQTEMLKRRPTILPMLKEYMKDDILGAEYKPADTSAIYDYWILEIPLAAYMLLGNVDKYLARSISSDQEYFLVATQLAVPENVSLNYAEILPYYVQAAKELGYYSYDIEPFKGLLSITSGTGILDKMQTPPGTSFTYDSSLNEKVRKFLSTTKSKMMFIYGANDPWTSLRPFSTARNNMKLYIIPSESHASATITNMPQAMKNEAISTLSSWLGVSAAN